MERNTQTQDDEAKLETEIALQHATATLSREFAALTPDRRTKEVLERKARQAETAAHNSALYLKGLRFMRQGLSQEAM